ncbi:MAG: tetratricopeptide repeat protein [Desulfuromusa sp.]|nr:tetratricopeptide repeat protein [Desulfuromusa sp.]
MKKIPSAQGSHTPANHCKADDNETLRVDLPVMAGIILLGIILYSNTLHVPWYMDDLNNILDNQAVHSLGNALQALFTSARGMVNLTFAVNYALAGDNVVGFHVVNITIHLLTSCIVFLLLKRAFRQNVLLAAGGALIFLTHPLQTQAVTYIVQRATSLAALFFFLAIYLYARARETVETKPKQQWLFYAGALVCGGIAVFTKQNTAILPVAILLFDRYFLSFEHRLQWNKLLYYLVPFALAPAWSAARSLLIPVVAKGEALATLGKMPNLVHLKHLSPFHYLFTEFSVLWLYLRLLLFPRGQALDYDYPIVATLFTGPTLIALMGIIILLVLAVIGRKKIPHLSFGILWFFLTLAIESTIIPLDPIFEHRLYIPMFGFGLTTMACLAKLTSRAALSIASVIILILAVLTWQRNALWNDPVAFYSNNLQSAPRNERVYLELGNAFIDNEQVTEARRAYANGLKINPDYTLLHIALSKSFARTKEYRKAVDLLESAIEIDPENDDLYVNLGGTYIIMKRYEQAIEILQKSLALTQDNPNIYVNLGVAYEQSGRLEKALGYFERAIQLDVNNPQHSFMLGIALSRHGKFKKALQAYLQAIKIDPDHERALFYAALASHQIGDAKLTRRLGDKLEQVNPALAKELARRISRSNKSLLQNGER